MFPRSTQTVFPWLAALALLTIGAGCTETKITSPTEKQKYAFAWALLFAIRVTPPGNEAAAVAAPQLLVSEPNGPGAVLGAGSTHIFEKSTSGYTSVGKIFNSNGVNHEGFGSSLAAKGNDVIVGAPGANSFTGKAFVFAHANNNFTQQGTLQASDAAAADYFGREVAIDGNRALVSAPFEDQAGVNAGAVYAFTRTGTTWAQSQKLTVAMSAIEDYFGTKVLLDGTEALISSGDSNGSAAYGGRVHTWNLVSGVWTEGPTIKPSDPSSNKGFGESLARQGKWLIVGAPFDSQTASQAGAAYVFERVGANWVERQKLRANDGTSDDWFGKSVAIDGNWLVVGALHANGKVSDAGAAYVFELDGTWTFAGKLIAKDGAAGDWFGSTCAVSGDQVAVGAPEADINGFNGAGAAYVFTIPQAFDPQRILTEARHFALGRK